MSDLTIAILAGLGGMLGWGSSDFFAKKTIDQIGDTVTLAWAHLFGSLAFMVIIVYQTSSPNGSELVFPNEINTLVTLFLFGVLQGVVYLFVYRAFGKGQIAIISPIFATYSAFTALISIFIFNEIVNNLILSGIFTLLLGVMLLSIDIGGLKERKINFAHIPGFGNIAIATILATIWTLFWGRFLGGKDWLSYTFIMYISMTLTIFLILKIQKLDPFVVKPHLWKFLILIGFGEVFAYLSISVGFSHTTFISIIALLSSAFSIPVIILARIFLKERVSRIQTIGTIILISGIMILSAS